MEFSRELPKNVNDPLRELFVSFYHKSALASVYPAAATALGIDPGGRIPAKGVLVQTLIELVDSPDRMSLFIERLPTLLRQVLEVLIWEDKISLTQLEDRVDWGIAYSNPKWEKSRSYSYEPPFLLQKGLELLVLWPAGYQYYSREVDRSEFWVAVPPAVRAWLGAYFPKPEGYYLVGRGFPPEAQKEKWRVFDCSAHALQDCVIVAEMLRRGALTRNTNGAVARAVLKKLAGLTGGGELYPDVTYSPKFPFFRHQFLVDFIDEVLPDSSKELLADAKIDPGTFLRGIVEALGGAPAWVLQKLLPHLRPEHAYAEPECSEEVLDGFLAIFGEVPKDQWVTKRQVVVYCRYREQTGCFFNYYSFQFQAEDHQRNNFYYKKRLYIDRDNMAEAVTWPLFSGLALGLAALGLVEVAYTEPRNERFHAGNNLYLSPFEGVKALRLTALGAYAFGQTEQLDLPELETSGTKLEFAPDRLHVYGERIDPVTDGILREYMVPVGPGLYKMTRTSFLKGCATTKEVAQHVRQFRQRLPEEFPPTWENFLQDLEKEEPALAQETGWVVFRVPENVEVRNAFARDPVLRKLALKVEGWRIAVNRSDVPVLEEQLRTLGFFPR